MNPLSPVATPTNGSAWYGAASLGLTYGAQNIARGPGEGGQHFTIIPLPVQPSDDLTMQARADAISAAYSGLLMQAVDMYRLTVERNGFMAGILLTMAHGFLGLPLSWQGDEEMVSALMDIRDHGGNILTPGDFARQHPENECAKIFSDGIGLGLGLGQYLLMCWRCDGVDWLRNKTLDPPEDAPQEEAQERAREVSALEFLARVGDRRSPLVQHAIRVTMARTAARQGWGPEREIETCKRCGAVRSERPIGVRELYQLRWRDPRWLWRNTVMLQWYYTGRQGMIPITPGDGEWFLFQTVPDQDIWVHGPWSLGTEAAIFTRDARYDMQAISATCAPAHVFSATGIGGGSDPRVREDVQRQADNLRFQNKLVLPGEWKHEIHAAEGGAGGYVGTADRITSWAQEQWEVYVTGIRQGTENGTGFANNGVLQRVSRERRAFYAGAWIRQIVDQGLRWWARGNFGGLPCPVGHYDTRSPEDKLAASKADTEEGAAVKALAEAYGAIGYELKPSYIEERAQAKGFQVQRRVMAPVLNEEQRAAVIMGGEARQALGRAPFGDERDTITVAELQNAGKAAGKTSPAPALPAAPVPPPPSAPTARVEEDDDDQDEEDARLAARADAMNAQGLTACRHNRTNLCRTCGVRGHWMPAEGGRWRVTWEPARVAAKTAGSPPT